MTTLRINNNVYQYLFNPLWTQYRRDLHALGSDDDGAGRSPVKFSPGRRLPGEIVITGRQQVISSISKSLEIE